jgi:hypothetical protein
MKKIYKAGALLLFVLFISSCEKDPELVTYPKSYPVFTQVQVSESTILYNDSISLSVQLSDKVTPLSTLEVQVVLNNEVITHESIRTKGNESEVIRKYKVPFGANAPDNSPVKVYLSSINVDGYSTDTIISNTVVKRPVITQLYIVPESGTTYKMELIDSANLIFRATNMAYGSSLKFRLAAKINKFNKADWSGPVFGYKDGGINLVNVDDDFIEISDPGLLSITQITFDAFALTTTFTGKPLEPVTTLDINNDLSAMLMAGKNFKGGNVYFGKDLEITFTGITNLSNSLAPDYFEVTGENTAKFIAPTGIYKAYYYVDGNYLYVEPQPDVIYPEALWVCGTGLGKPSSPYTTTTSWNWNTPFDYVPCVKISEGVYQFTAYMKNTPDGSGYGTLDFKYFFKRGWWDADHEINASLYTVSEPLYGLWVEGKYGNVNGGTAPFEGVYRVTLDMNNNTLTPVKIN